MQIAVNQRFTDYPLNVNPSGFEEKEIPFVLVLDKEGNPINLESTYEGTGKNKRAKRFLVPQSVKKSSGINSNLFWENAEYALGVCIKGKQSRVAEQHEFFVKKICSVQLEDDGLKALQTFLKKEDKLSSLSQLSSWSEFIESKGANVSFRLDSDSHLICERLFVKNFIASNSANELNENHLCIVSGDKIPISRLHSSIKGVWGAQSSGANIVSFNKNAFTSFNKDQGLNAPVGEPVTFAYTTALNHLLGKDSTQRMQVGDASTCLGPVF